MVRKGQRDPETRLYSCQKLAVARPLLARQGLCRKRFAGLNRAGCTGYAKIRNHLEHRYLKIHERNPVYALPSPKIYKDRLALFVQRGDFEAKALRVLKLARVAMIHLCLAMHREENIRAKTNTGFAMPMTLPAW
jgi:hypothetical protein